MHIELSEKFNIKKLLLFSLPCIGIQLIDNTYQVVDGYFISNFLGEEMFASENIIFPPLMLVMSIGYVIGAGGSAVLSSQFGEGHKSKARELLSMFTLALFVMSVIFAGILGVFLPRIAEWIGAEGSVIGYCSEYGRVLLCFMPFQILSLAFQEFLIVDNRGKLTFLISVTNAAVNIVLDFILVGVFRFGLTGAAVATGIAWLCSSMIALRYFMNKKHDLHFSHLKTDFASFAKAVGNGMSEMVDAVSYVIVAILFNAQLLKYLSVKGVAAYAVTEYITGIFNSVFVGFGFAIIPVIGYKWGNKDLEAVRKIRNDGLKIASFAGIAMAVPAFAFAGVIARIYIGYDEELTQLAATALRITSFSYLLCGVNMFSSSFFTGISDGLASAVIAMLRSLAFPVIFIFALPAFFGADAIWFSVLCGEFLTLFGVVLMYRFRFQKRGILTNGKV